MINLVEEIKKADDIEIHSLLRAALNRYNELSEDWELSVIALQKNGDPNEQIDKTISLLQMLKSI